MRNNRSMTKKQFREIINSLAARYSYDIHIVKVSALFIEVYLGHSVVTGLFVSDIYNAIGSNFIIEKVDARIVFKFSRMCIKEE